MKSIVYGKTHSEKMGKILKMFSNYFFCSFYFLITYYLLGNAFIFANMYFNSFINIKNFIECSCYY